MTTEEKRAVLESANRSGRQAEFKHNNGEDFASNVSSNSNGDYFFCEPADSSADEGKLGAEPEPIRVEEYISIEII